MKKVIFNEKFLRNGENSADWGPKTNRVSNDLMKAGVQNV